MMDDEITARACAVRRVVQACLGDTQDVRDDEYADEYADELYGIAIVIGQLATLIDDAKYPDVPLLVDARDALAKWLADRLEDLLRRY